MYCNKEAISIAAAGAFAALCSAGSSTLVCCHIGRFVDKNLWFSFD
jgi:hypothetical protein